MKKKMNFLKTSKTLIIAAPMLIVLSVFGATAASLRIIAKCLHLTYNEVNIIGYYLIIPLTWCMMVDCLYQLPILTTLWVALWTYIIITKRKFFSKWCDTVFQLSVEFLLKFQRIGWDYWTASVIICVVVPILIYIILYLLI